MANAMSLSHAQVRALAKFLAKHMPKSIDALVKEIGLDEAFRLTALNERLQQQVEE